MGLELKLTELHDKHRHFLVRVCMLVADMALAVAGSEQRPCDECGEPVWYATQQDMSAVEAEMEAAKERGEEYEREVLLCLPCYLLHQMVEEESDSPVQKKWIGPRPF